ncbi:MULTISPECIES: preprotein translocase subunit SecG [Clostridia]|uniref:preprotein translocase subunit SecG n=1 Tax=Clostridium sp. CCUG 7971 TaxID=2811414 RepID=UPI0025708E35|nr:preprotein translocase subunit SecG [Clostridium sp. CCUG 7971]
MNLGTILMGVQVVLAVLLIVSIMPQDSKGAVPSQFGGEGNQTYFKPKGKEAFLGRLTKITSVLFFLNALAMLLLKK